MAISDLRNGRDVFTLQLIVARKSLAVLQRYLTLTEKDIQEAHARASPVDNF